MWFMIFLLLLLGTLFLLAELFVIGGVIGFIGVALMGMSVFLSFEHYGWTAGMAVLAFSVVLSLGTLIGGFYVLPRIGLRKGFILDTSTSSEGGYTSDSYIDDNLEGKEGVTESGLRPSGIALIDGERIDVVSDGEFIEPGTPIKVIQVNGNRVVVERI